ncbi:methylated-DNA--[protein]-cysteine S-methyltransferase [Alpinimonas psychrophila]|uniref:Methylated-DNA--protein-cysteine methyltransferase n=1 Tax=Alpinimonas psychrophila TaxID=748908 RepID=A0A7W3PPC0_9MICO|nr:methylated-DNA--[protein]-cysteine S-methyltransferase [Alpinimonas psychrophila]MBA8829305.1 methylated-DNA-[protein]-cysteine S-methyltransferase [Alpinimonas psychrophila]
MTKTLHTVAATSAANPVAGLTFATIDSPLGRIELESNGHALTWLSIEGDENSAHGTLRYGGANGTSGNAANAPDAVLAQAIAELGEYFAGERREFTVPVELSGTPFQQSVWAQLQGIGWGEHLSYADIAEAIGKPGAFRAVGGAVGANPVPLIVGCHRVLARDGRITGYSGGRGIITKQYLLTLEGIESR